MDDRAKVISQSDKIPLFTQFAMDNASTEIYWLGSDARIHYVNKQACKTLGYSKEELLELAIPDLDPLYPIEKWNEHWESLKRDKTQMFETQHRRKNGELMTVQVTANYVQFGNLEYNVAYCTDITERKGAEKALSDAYAQLRTLVQTIPDLVWLKDADGVYLNCNTRLEQFFGKKESEIVGKTDYELVDQDLAEFFRANDRAAILKGSPSLNEELITFASDGHQEFQETTKTPMLNAEGQLIGILGIGHDITVRNRMETALAQKESHLRAILETISECVKLVARDGTVISMNRAGLSFCEADSPGEVINHCVLNLIAPEYRDAFKSFGERICDGESGSMEFEAISLRGTRRWMETRAVPFQMVQNGEFVQLAITQEITQRKLAETRLKLAGSIWENCSEGVFVTDAESLIISVNPAFTKITGYSAEEVIGKNPRMFSSGTQSKTFYRNLWGALNEQGSWAGEMHNRRKNGKSCIEWLSINKFVDSNNQINYVAIFSDITERKKAEMQLEHLAHFDMLTGLPNRTLFSDRLNQAVISAKRDQGIAAILFLDLDMFKSVNDLYGHHTGDCLLKEASKRLLDCVRESDTVCRLGGDEFVVLLTSIEQDDFALLVAEKIRCTLNIPFEIEGHLLQVSSSIGIAIYPHHGEDEHRLLRAGDMAMYSAKKSGRNRVQVYDVSI